MPSFKDRLIHAWNAFTNKDPPKNWRDVGVSHGCRPDRKRLTRGNDRTIINAIYTRIATDCASIKMEHIRTDENGRYVGLVESGLNECLRISANTDQTGTAFKIDMFMSMLDEGVVAVVPTDTSISVRNSNSFDILTMRVGKIVEWYPRDVKINLYNEATGLKEDIMLPKKAVAIIENPFYSIMNEPNSTLQRLVHKLSLLDSIDEQVSSGKLDLILQLPYLVKGEARKAQANARRAELEQQLSGTKYGIAYTDGTEKIQQLNRPITNNLMEQIEFLTKELYNQLGMTPEVLNGTADEKTMLNYYERVVEVIVNAAADEFRRKFLTKTARTQGQDIMVYYDPFKLISMTEIANIADTFTRNAILTSNEIRQIIGFKPSDDPQANELSNKNMPASEQGGPFTDPMNTPEPQQEVNANNEEAEEGL